NSSSRPRTRASCASHQSSCPKNTTSSSTPCTRTPRNSNRSTTDHSPSMAAYCKGTRVRRASSAPGVSGKERIKHNIHYANLEIRGDAVSWTDLRERLPHLRRCWYRRLSVPGSVLQRGVCLLAPC